LGRASLPKGVTNDYWFVIEPELLKRVDNFRFKNRFQTRAATIKWLLAWSLDQKPVPPKKEE
jgi:hypothetical protein